MRSVAKKAVSAAGAVITAAAFSLALAAPANATAADCEAFLRGKGYVVGPGASGACEVAASVDGWVEEPAGWMVCVEELGKLGVILSDAKTACDLAQR